MERNESCGGHFREEFQTSDGEAIRDDENFKFVSAWEYNQDPSKPILNKEGLDYEEIEIKQDLINNYEKYFKHSPSVQYSEHVFTK